MTYNVFGGTLNLAQPTIRPASASSVNRHNSMIRLLPVCSVQDLRIRSHHEQLCLSRQSPRHTLIQSWAQTAQPYYITHLNSLLHHLWNGKMNINLWANNNKWQWWVWMLWTERQQNTTLVQVSLQNTCPLRKVQTTCDSRSWMAW